MGKNDFGMIIRVLVQTFTDYLKRRRRKEKLTSRKIYLPYRNEKYGTTVQLPIPISTDSRDLESTQSSHFKCHPRFSDRELEEEEMNFFAASITRNVQFLRSRPRIESN